MLQTDSMYMYCWPAGETYIDICMHGWSMVQWMLILKKIEFPYSTDNLRCRARGIGYVQFVNRAGLNVRALLACR